MNLKYRIYSVSSQNLEFPAGNLQDNTGIWESQKNCTYPQELTVQFYIPIRTENMKIMFHQYKIPKLIQVFIRCGKHEKYRKLGLIQPNDNEQSNYLQKEIKTVLFQFPCTFVKLVFHQNYQNKLNLFSQIAICSLSFEGQFCPSSQLKQLNSNVLDFLQTSSDEQQLSQSEEHIDNKSLPKLQQEKKSSSNNFSSALFPQFFEKLQVAKRQAVQRQQFQKASFIKNSITNFQQMEKQIIRLEELKKIAIEEEDYDRCHKLKNEIGRKKQMIAYQIKEFNDQISDQSGLAFSRVTQNQHNASNFITQKENKPQPRIQIQNTPATNRNPPPANQYQNQVVPALRNKKNNIEQSYYSNAKLNESVMQGLKSPNTQRKQEAEYGQESVDMRSYDIGKIMYEFPQLEQLDFKSFKKYEPFFDYIRQDIWRMVLSYKYQKYWKLKSAALDEVLGSQVTEGKHLIAIMQLVAITICDKHTVNIKKSLLLLEKLVNLPDKDLWCDPNYPRYFVDVILSNLIQLMNDTKEQFRKMAVQIYKNLPQFSLVYLETAIRNIIKSSSAQFNKNKRKSNPRLQQVKLAVIQYYLSTFADVVHHLNQIIKWLAQCANDPSSQVKITATQMLLQIARMDKQLYSKVKEELTKQSQDAWAMFQPQYNALIAEIQSSKLIKAPTENQNQESLNIYKKQTMKSKKNTSRVTSQQANDSLFLSPRQQRDSEDVELAYSQESMTGNQSRSHEWFANSTDQKQIKVMELEDHQEDLEGMCDYCYKKYDEPTLNEHLLNNCCVVIPCAHCGWAIYLREMTEHLLTACDKKKHQQCPRCLLAFEFDEINEHVARKICRKAKPHMERCPFCEEDIEPDDVSWVDHAQKCDKIVRPPRRQMDVSTQSH